MTSFAWYRLGGRVGAAFVALVLIVAEAASPSYRRAWWRANRGMLVLLCTTWAALFTPHGGLAHLMGAIAPDVLIKVHRTAAQQ